MGWVIRNERPYGVRDLRMRVLHFKKFEGLGWHNSISSERQLLDTLTPGNSTTVDLQNWLLPYSIKDKSGKDIPAVLGADLHVIALSFQRELDDKRYLYLEPFVTWPGYHTPKEVRTDLAAMGGPAALSCTMDAYAVELSYEFFRRNPLPYPVEPYNYHYLVGEPTATCLQSGPRSLRW
jgi:hypothetical protein